MVAELVSDKAPDRDDFSAEEPEKSADSYAPYGLKKDGTPAKKRGRPSGSTNSGFSSGPRVSTGKSLETQIGGMLMMVNMPLQLIPALQKDSLDRVEIEALAKSINQECQRSPRFRKYVESMLKVQGATSIVSVVSIIAARRVVRHELFDIPAEIGGVEGVDQTLGSLLSVISGQGAINPNLAAMKSTEG